MCNQQSLRSACAYAQSDLWLCWSHIPHCWKSHARAYLVIKVLSKSLILIIGVLYHVHEEIKVDSNANVNITAIEVCKWEPAHVPSE